MIRSTLFASIILTALFTGCVTVNLGGNGGGKRATGVAYVAPVVPFEKESREDVDAAWKNAKNGNVISFLSDCKDPSDPPLDHIIQGVLSGVSDLHYDQERDLMFQGREARRSLASGKVDGVPTRMDLLVFKRNQCIYIVSYVGVQKTFAENQREFDQFVSGFRAP